MKRILIAAVAAATLSAAPAQAQDLDVLMPDLRDPAIAAACLTPVTKCVDEAADKVVAAVERVYDRVGELIKEGPDLGAVCELIWEDGCGTDSLLP